MALILILRVSGRGTAFKGPERVLARSAKNLTRAARAFTKGRVPLPAVRPVDPKERRLDLPTNTLSQGNVGRSSPSRAAVAPPRSALMPAPRRQRQRLRGEREPVPQQPE